MRILVTGSRDWTDEEAVFEALFDVVCQRGVEAAVVVEGGCPAGADAAARWWASQTVGVTLESRPADWKKHGKPAGFIRNKQMVDLGADLCLAFIRNESKGASMTARLAQEAGIPTRIFRIDDNPA